MPRLHRPHVPPFYYAAVALYLLLRAGSFLYRPVVVTDTKTYEQAAQLPFWSVSFFAGQRAFTLPLVYKLVSGDHARITGQLFFSIACWLTLATVVALSVDHRRLRPVAFVLVLLFSATTEVILWDPLLLSESISVSLTALLFAALLWLVRAPSVWALAATLVIMVFWAFVRDSNAYLVLIVGAVAAVLLLRPQERPVKLALVAGCLAVFVLSAVSASEGRRWYQPLRDILLNRIDADPEMRRHFERKLGPRWKEADARRVYAGYLASHPGYTFVEPFLGTQDVPYSSHRGAAALLEPDLRIYNDNASDRVLVLPRRVNRALWPASLPGLLVATVAIVVLAVVAGIRYGVSPLWLIPLVAVLSTYPHGLLIWHLSGLEVDRHALEVALVLRIALLLTLILALDSFLEHSVAVQRVGARVSEWRARLRAGSEENHIATAVAR